MLLCLFACHQASRHRDQVSHRSVLSTDEHSSSTACRQGIRVWIRRQLKAPAMPVFCYVRHRPASNLMEKYPFVCMDHSASGCSVTNGSSTLTCNIGGLSFGKPNVTTVLQLRAVSAGTGLIVVNATGVSVLGAAFQTRATQLVSLALCAAAQGDR